MLFGLMAMVVLFCVFLLSSLSDDETGSGWVFPSIPLILLEMPLLMYSSILVYPILFPVLEPILSLSPRHALTTEPAVRCSTTPVDSGNRERMQGMNFVCRSLLQVYQDEEEAFWVFVGMLQRFRLRELYCPGMPLLRLRCVREIIHVHYF